MAKLKTMFLHTVCMLQLLGANGQVVEMDQQQSGKDLHKVSLPTLSKPFSFASYYTNNMVLQRAPKRAVIWGYGPNIGEEITISVSNKGTYKTRVYQDPSAGYGVWKVKLAAESDRGPFTITVVSSNKTIEIIDVLFGDVWVCSGQSNMQFVLSQAFNATEEILDAVNYPDIRLFTVQDIAAIFPIPDLKGILEKWQPASITSVGGKEWLYFSAVCWLYGKALYKELGYPIGLIDTTWGGTPVEAWSSYDALAKCGLENQPYETGKEDLLQQKKDGVNIVGGPSDPSNLWNGMVNPLLNMTIYGAIWYQGEANSLLNIHKYNCTFPAMIDDWRVKFHCGSDGETDLMFPFGFVQLAPNRQDAVSLGFPEIRWHQTADFGYVPNPRMRNVFMAVAIDLPDFFSPWGSIHPRDKQDVAARLLLGGLSVAYKKTGLLYQGPLPSHIGEGGSNITLHYKMNIKVHNMGGFECLCSNEKLNMSYWMPLAILTSKPDLVNTVTLWPAAICGTDALISGIRYLWRESPCAFKMCSVYSADNPLLPGPPFVVYQQISKKEGTVHRIDWTSSTTVIV